ncbi:glutamate ABC transporter substrate-binding protein [Streptomyces palmae]|uniref:Glutamate ABC transporter substrate-binding protein n=1 Tax=Streptomyces palmae TaxID=1701085 RepID=A0A4Z0H7R8_9ACTN|nr:glutamate ABC transporter substrate-binding protein [Streptomyces palmae]
MHHRLSALHWRGDLLRLRGHARIEGVTPLDTRTELVLRPRDTERPEVRLPVTVFSDPELPKEQAAAGFVVDVDPAAADRGRPLGAGVWEVWLEVRAQGVGRIVRYGRHRASGRATTAPRRLLPTGDGSADDKGNSGGRGQPEPGATDGTTASPSGGEPSGGKKITIGVKTDQPGLGFRTPEGRYKGFDIDVATYIAKALGHAPGDIEWTAVPSSQREAALRNGEVDLVVATYTRNEERAKRVDFAGPYLRAHQGLLLPADGPSVRLPEDLDGKRVCAVTGSTAGLNLRTRFAPAAQLQERATYTQCLDDLTAGSVDAVSSDDAILAGYAADRPSEFKLADLKLTDELYYVGLPKGSALKGKVQQSLKKMVSDGSWNKSLRQNLPLLQGEAPPL